MRGLSLHQASKAAYSGEALDWHIAQEECIFPGLEVVRPKTGAFNFSGILFTP